MPHFDQSSFAQGQFGSQFVTISTLKCGGSATIAIGVVLRRVCALSTAGSSSIATRFVRTRRAAASTTSHASTTVQVVRRKPLNLSSSGTGTVVVSVQRRRVLYPFPFAGSSRTSIAFVRKMYRALPVSGTSVITIRAVKLALPPPVSAGIRVAPWTRPVFQSNLRFTRWTAAA